MSDSNRMCNVYAYISEWFALTSAIHEGRLNRSMTMKGRINDSGTLSGLPDERFHGQGIRLLLSAPCNEDWTSKIRQLEGVSHVCGAASIEANVTPRTYDFDGQIVEMEPVQIRFSLSVEAFNAIQQQAYDAEQRGHRLEMNATLSGKSLPDISGLLGMIALKDLDVSEQREFAVTAVSFISSLR